MYSISFVETEPQLKQVLDFCYGILGQHLRGISPYRYEDWKERIERDSKLLVYAHEDGNVVSAVLGRRENAESLVCGFVACEICHRRQGITKKLMDIMDIFEAEAVQAGFRYITLGSEEDGFYEKCGFHVINEMHGQKIYQKLLRRDSPNDIFVKKRDC